MGLTTPNPTTTPSHHHLLLTIIIIAWYLPAYGQRILAFLHDLKHYRNK
jgi:hypothetical protein